MNIGKSITHLHPLIEVDKSLCVNCHSCIAACPVKYCNDASDGNVIAINHDLCIGCGRCLGECSHKARKYIDDFTPFLDDITKGEKCIMVIEPAVVASFGSMILNLNGWLQSIGVEAIFETGFGIELALKSYIEHFKNSGKSTLIPLCPSIVKYIELYQQDLLDSIVPYENSTGHTITMVRNGYPEYADYPIVVLTTCLSAVRDLKESAQASYVIGISSLKNYMLLNGVDINKNETNQFKSIPEPDQFTTLSSEGMTRTIERIDQNLASFTRTIMGPVTIQVIDSLRAIEENKNHRQFLTCFMCDLGCLSGPLLTATPSDEDQHCRCLPDLINGGSEKEQKTHTSASFDILTEEILMIEQQEHRIQKVWKDTLFQRDYKDLRENNRILFPNEEELHAVYQAMHNQPQGRLFNCKACGYGSCQRMAIAIFNNLTTYKNCPFYVQEEAALIFHDVIENEHVLRNILLTTPNGFCTVNEQSVITNVNDSLCIIMDMDKEAIIGSSILRDQFQTCLKGAISICEFKISRSDGSNRVCLFNAAPLYNTKNIVTGAFAILSDISDYCVST